MYGVLSGSGGLSEAQEAELCQILLAKEVPEDEVKGRVQAAVKKMGGGPIAAALQGRNPWQGLKSAGSKPGIGFRWILPHELQAYIQAKTQEKFGTEVTRPKTKKAKAARQGPTILQVDPKQLLLPSGSFTSAGGAPLAQLDFAEVQAQASRICFCTPVQAAPFLADGKSLRVDALALLITAPVPCQEWGLARIADFTFPAIYSPTQEGILIRGALLQLGDEDVQAAVSAMADVECVQTLVCRLSVFRDEFKAPWAALQEAPIRVLINTLPELQICKDPGCNHACNHFHPAVEEAVSAMFQDVWGRSFSKLAGGKIQASDADVFTAFVRVPESAMSHLFRISAPGFYVEPRSADGSTHASWSVIWLPGFSLARHNTRCAPTLVQWPSPGLALSTA